MMPQNVSKQTCDKLAVRINLISVYVWRRDHGDAISIHFPEYFSDLFNAYRLETTL